MSYEIVKAGAYTTFQDMGRRGLGKYGIARSGAMDSIAASIAGILVDAPQGSVVLESTGIHPVVRFSHADVVAVTGCDLVVKRNDEVVPSFTAFAVYPGDVVEIQQGRRGWRAYIATACGFNAPMSYSSHSVDTNLKISGSKLKDGDHIQIRDAIEGTRRKGRYLPQRLHDQLYPLSHDVLALVGPEFSMMDLGSHKALFGSEYTIGGDSNRMGYRLTGPMLKGCEILSDALIPGTIQLPPSGQPMLLTADSGTTGGYARIAVIATAEMHRVAQMRPGEHLTFRQTDVEGARTRLWELNDILGEIVELSEQFYFMDEISEFNIKISGADREFRCTVMELHNEE